MGLDLTVAPMDLHSLDWWLCYNRLQFKRDYELFEKIDNVGRNGRVKKIMNPQQIPCGKRVEWYDDDGVVQVTEDAYGRPLTFVRAEEFKKFSLTDDMCRWNEAIIRFLGNLPEDIPIILYWH